MQNIVIYAGLQPSSNCSVPREKLKRDTEICTCFLTCFDTHLKRKKKHTWHKFTSKITLGALVSEVFLLNARTQGVRFFKQQMLWREFFKQQLHNCRWSVHLQLLRQTHRSYLPKCGLIKQTRVTDTRGRELNQNISICSKCSGKLENQ